MLLYKANEMSLLDGSRGSELELYKDMLFEKNGTKVYNIGKRNQREYTFVTFYKPLEKGVLLKVFKEKFITEFFRNCKTTVEIKTPGY